MIEKKDPNLAAEITLMFVNWLLGQGFFCFFSMFGPPCLYH